MDASAGIIEMPSDAAPFRSPLEILDVYRGANNLADFVNAAEIASFCGRRFDFDKNSNQRKFHLIRQIRQHSTQFEAESDGEKSNIVYPLMVRAAIEFASTIVPLLYAPEKDVMKVEENLGEQHTPIAERVCKFMNRQLKTGVMGWACDLFQLFQNLALYGTMYRKLYKSSWQGFRCDLLYPDELIVPCKYRGHLKYAPAVSQEFVLYPFEIEQMIESGDFVRELMYEKSREEPYKFIEQHTWMDLDKDGIKEPYVAILMHDTKTLVRLEPRFDEDGIMFRTPDKVAMVEPQNSFVRYRFLPPFDGGNLGFGIGEMLLGMNAGISTSINQLIDSGKLANTQSGIIGSGIRIREGQIRIKSGEFKFVKNTGPLNENIHMWNFKEPSPTLFQLCQFMVIQGEKLGYFIPNLGAQIKSDTAETVGMGVIESVERLFNGIYTMQWHSLHEEITLQAEMNRNLVTDQEYMTVLQSQEPLSAKQEFSAATSLYTLAADKNGLSAMKRAKEAGVLVNFLQDDIVNGVEVRKRIFEANQMSAIEALLPRPPSPEEVQQQQAEQAKVEQQDQLTLANLEADARKKNAEAARLTKEIEVMQAEIIEKAAKAEQLRAQAEKATTDAIVAVHEAGKPDVKPKTDAS